MIEKEYLIGTFRTTNILYTAIYYLLTRETYSALHWLPTDEIFHFYLDDPVSMLNLYEDGTSSLIKLGQDLLNGHHVQYKVPGGAWQGSFLQRGWKFGYGNDHGTWIRFIGFQTGRPTNFDYSISRLT